MGILDDNNFLVGTFDRDAPKRTEDEWERSARRWAIAGLVLSIAWLLGIGSLLGILAGATARGDAQSVASKRLALAAIILGVIGLAVPVLLRVFS